MCLCIVHYNVIVGNRDGDQLHRAKVGGSQRETEPRGAIQGEASHLRLSPEKDDESLFTVCSVI